MDCITTKGKALSALAHAVRAGEDATEQAALVAHLFPGNGADLAYRQMAGNGDLNVAHAYMRRADHANCELCA